MHKIFLWLKRIIRNLKIYPTLQAMNNLYMWMSLQVSWSFHCITFNRQKIYMHNLLYVLTLKQEKMETTFCWLRLGLVNMVMNLSVPQKVWNSLTSKVTTHISKRTLLHGIYMVLFLLKYISELTYIVPHAYDILIQKIILLIGTSDCTCILLLCQHASPWLLQKTCHKIT